MVSQRHNIQLKHNKTTWILKRQCMLLQRKLTLLFPKAFDKFCSFSTLCLWPCKQCISFLLGLQFLVLTEKIGQNILMQLFLNTWNIITHAAVEITRQHFWTVLETIFSFLSVYSLAALVFSTALGRPTGANTSQL